MMIATLALAQTDTPDVAQIESFEQDQKSLERTKARIEQIKLEISDSLKIREQQQQNDINKAEITKMLAELEAVEKELAEQKKIEIVIPKVDPKARETASDMQTQFEQLEMEIAQLEKDLKERKDKSENNSPSTRIGIEFQAPLCRMCSRFICDAHTNACQKNPNRQCSQSKRIHRPDATGSQRKERFHCFSGSQRWSGNLPYAKKTL